MVKSENRISDIGIICYDRVRLLMPASAQIVATSRGQLQQHRGEHMSATTWKATIRLPNGNQQEVRVQANSQQNATAMIESQFGRGNILFGVHKVDLTRW
jgi:hypothetical protein